ncbi:type II secretion system F family protein [Streptomyces sp. SP18CS02]|uniref:type II secretion system F family protein n=1 Tax=Streptomyces sp. SP18CS02 TaxID=3002531 RepID=UPI002E79E3E7|nr:type II secretion system F family protein [Streptomyces sp. SP18CS02]MEE1756821.1 type II secretion system F family protein [Streptomyces sp. SP18CS02]
MVVAVLSGAAWAAVSSVDRRRARRARARLGALSAVDGRQGARWPRLRVRAARWVAPVGAAVAGWVLVGDIAGCVVAGAAAYGVWRWQRRPRPVAEDEGTVPRLPLAADLLAACLSAGAGPSEAAEAVGESLGGQVGERLRRTAAELRLGGDPADVWGRFAEIPGARELARCLERAGASGAPAADAVTRLAAVMRAERAREAEARAQRAQVLITAPVGLCFLPAFLAVGVAPVVIGLASALL